MAVDRFTVVLSKTMRVHHTKIWRPDIYRKREEDGVKEKI
jgi:hypothetical protein